MTSSTNNPRRIRQYIGWFIKLVVLLAVIFAVRRSLLQAWHQLDQYRWQIGPAQLIVAGVVYFVAFLPAGLFWYHALCVLGQHPQPFEALRAYYIGHLGKYIPGKAAVVFLRTVLVRSERVSTTVAAASVFLETLTMMAVGAAWAAVFLAWRFAENSFYLAVACLLLVVSVFPTLPPVFSRLLRLALRKFENTSPDEIQHVRLRLSTLLLGWVLMICLWFGFGLSYWFVLNAMGISVPLFGQWGRLSASVALATVAGFVLVALPGGVGVREAALASLMIPFLRNVTENAELVAWASAAILRLVWISTEAGVAGMLYIAGRNPLLLLPGHRTPVDSSS